MAKPIKLTEALIQQMTKEFEEKLRSTRLASGKVDYTKAFTYQGDDTKIKVLFDPLAYLKMLALVDHFSSEVGWHGTVERVANDVFVIKDILVYPQVVAAATVNTDQEGYTKWLMSLDDDTFNAMHMHGHSHVYMATGPSSVDDTHREMILSQIGEEDFYIFIIWNKRNEYTVSVYDLKTNTLYEDKDVEVGINGNNFDMDAFLGDADRIVVKKQTSYVYGGTSAAGANTVTSTKTGKEKKSKKVDLKKGGLSSITQSPGYYGGLCANEIEDYDDYVFGGRRAY